MIMLELITEVPSCHWWSYLHHQLLKNGNSEVVYEPKMNLKSMSGLMIPQNPKSPMVGAEYQKIIDARFIYQRIFVSFGYIFISELFADYLISFLQNIWE